MAAPAKKPTELPKDVFRDCFKLYKSNKLSPDLTTVIDFEKCCDTAVHPVLLREPQLPHLECLEKVDSWKAYGHTKFPGFVFILNPFQDGYQRYWVKRCLHDYPCKPNICNLDAHMTLGASDNIWEQSQQSGDKSLLKKLRWVTLGYHHNWDTKEYSPDSYTDFPQDLGYLSQYISAALGYDVYNAEAAIINYYHLDSTLSGHTDHSEMDQEAPLISASFGCTAIFLLGGLTKAEKPIAMYLRSGDIVVMMGLSRLAYHAIPKILPCPNEISAFQKTTKKDVEVHQASGTAASQFGAGAECCDARNQYEKKTSSRDAVSVDACDRKSKYQRNNVETNNGYQVDTPIVPLMGTQSEGICSSSQSTVKINASSTPKMHIVENLNTQMAYTLKHMEWEGYRQYMRTSRINMNVRQVLKPGKPFGVTE